MYKVLRFLNRMYENRNVPNFYADNQTEFKAAQSMFACDVSEILRQMECFAPELRGIQVRSCMQQFRPNLSPDEVMTGRRHCFNAVLARCEDRRTHASYQLCLEPENCFVAGGLVIPNAKSEKKIRNFIIQHTKEFEEVINAPHFKMLFPNFGDELRQKYPRGLQREERFEQYMYIREFVVRKKLNNRELSSKYWRSDVAKIFHSMQPFVNYLNHAIDHADDF